VRAALADASVRTPDLGGTDSTAAMGDEIVRRIRAAN
jgi:isocitrate/isopropylmalate dehydrogenase